MRVRLRLARLGLASAVAVATVGSAWALERAASSPVERPGEAATLRAAISLSASGQTSAAAALAASIDDGDARLALAWAELRQSRDATLTTLAAFDAAHPGWAGEGWICAAKESLLLRQNAGLSGIQAALGERAPCSDVGRYARARALKVSGAPGEADAQIRALWRNGAEEPWLEAIIVHDEAPSLTRADDVARADRLIYAGRYEAALRAAARVDKAFLAEARIRVSAAHGATLPAMSPEAPGASSLPPGAILAQAQSARHGKRLVDAAGWLALAPTDAPALVDPDAWWRERRQLIRALIDDGHIERAFALASSVRAGSAETRTGAEFLAGWIALRFMNAPDKAASHLAAARALSAAPEAIARADYWRGRALALLGDAAASQAAYADAARFRHTFYGQRSAELAISADATPREPGKRNVGARTESIRAADWLFAAGADDLAVPLSIAALSRARDVAEATQVADLFDRYGDPASKLAFGRLAEARGFDFESEAYPDSGIPFAEETAEGVDRPTTLAVMRQESGFVARAASGAGARGLMQLLPGTAREAARRAGLAFDEQRFDQDPSFNATLGAAYLGQLERDLGGDPAIALAAYNAGPGRVLEWFRLYGDPRQGDIDVVDWIERIPFDETRDYVQRVSEAISTYRARLAPAPVAQAAPIRVAGD